MRFTTAALALTLATNTSTNAFLPHLVTPHCHLHTILKSTSEWSNDDFLESLGKSQDDIADANEKYYRYSEAKANMNQWMAEQQQQPGRPTVPLDVEGMEQPLAQGMPQQQPPPPDGMQQPGVSSGGERFRRMVEQQQQQQGPPPPMDMYAQQQQQQPPSPYAQQPPPVAQQPPPPAMDPYAQQQQQPPPYPPQYQYPPQDPYTQQQPPYPQQQQQQPPYPPQDPNAPQPYPPQQQPPPYYPPQQQQQQQPYPPQQQQPYPPPPQPQKPGPGPGRNPDAHTIANTSDLYLEQLKLDSRIRKGAFLRGDTEKAQQVFEDPNVQQLKDVLQDNPYLRAKTTGNAVETSEDEMVAVMRQTAMSEKGKSAKMVSYRDKLKERQLKKKKGEPVVATSEPVQVAPPEPVQVIPPTPPQVDTPVPQTATIPPPLPQPTTTNEQPNEETYRRQIRTTMGLLLKHRGGPGFGAGLLKQPEAQRMVDAVAETSQLLRSELAATQEVVVQPPIISVERPPVVTDADTTTSFLDPSIQCAEAALQMVKTAPASEQSKLLPSLRDALVSTIDRLNQVIETEGGSMTEQVQQQQQQPQRGMQSFAEVASDMSLPNWTQLEQETPEAPSMDETTSVKKEELTREVVAPKEHLQLLKTTLAQLTTAKGNGKLGLDPSLTADDAAKLVDSLEGLRTVLLNELDMAPKSRDDSVQTENVVEVEPESQGGSKYQEMLAKAKAVKEEKNVA